MPFMGERTDTTNYGRRRHLIPILILAQLVGVDNSFAEEVDGVIFLQVHTTFRDWNVHPILPGSGDHSPGTSAAIEGAEEVKWPKRQQDKCLISNHSSTTVSMTIQWSFSFMFL